LRKYADEMITTMLLLLSPLAVCKNGEIVITCVQIPCWVWVRRPRAGSTNSCRFES